MSRAEMFARSARDRLQAYAAHGQRVVFFHVPKCGGSSIQAAFQRSITFHGLGGTTLDPKSSRRAAELLGENYLDVRERWLVYTVVQARNAYITGHFPFSPALAPVKGDYRFVTLLREPSAQLLSEFFYNRDRTNRGHFTIDRDVALKDWLQTEDARLVGSKFVQYFTDPALRATPTTAEAIEAAGRNLATLDVVGTLEHLDTWVDDVERVTGRRLVVGHERSSPTPKAKREAETDDEARAMVEELVAPNRAVYEVALGLSAPTRS